MLNNKKAEIGETITWVVATVVIIVVLIIFIFASSVLAKFQSLKVDSGEISVVYGDNLKTKTDLAFGRNGANKAEINTWIENLEKES